MSFVDLILNIAGLLLWLNWRSARYDPLARTPPATLVGTLRRAAATRFKRWHFLTALGGLLFLRAFFYVHLGSAVDWSPHISLGIIAVHFRSYSFSRMLLYSLFSFGVALAAVYLWLLLLSLLNRRGLTSDDPIRKLVPISLGAIDRLPRAVKLILPFPLAALSWLALAPLLAGLQIIPAASGAHRLGESALIGLWVYLGWRYAIGLVLALHIVHSYVYLGPYPVWDYVNQCAQTLLKPLRGIPLRFGKVDFTPLLVIALAFLGAALVEAGLKQLYARLPA